MTRDEPLPPPSNPWPEYGDPRPVLHLLPPRQQDWLLGLLYVHGREVAGAEWVAGVDRIAEVVGLSASQVHSLTGPSGRKRRRALPVWPCGSGRLEGGVRTLAPLSQLVEWLRIHYSSRYWWLTWQPPPT